MRFHKTVLTLGCCSMLLAACGGTDNNIENDLLVDKSSAGFIAQFAPGDGIIPFPSNLLLSGSTDGTLNIPVEDENDYSDPSVALNELNGFSTIAPMKTGFNLAIDASTINAQTIRMYEVTLTGIGGAVTSVVRELIYGVEFVASLSPVDPENKTLSIIPLAPLAPATSYMVALTNGIQSSDGRIAAPEATYVIAKNTSALIDGSNISQVAILTDEEAQALEPVRQLTNAQEAALAGQGLSSDIVILSWSFTTQPIGAALALAKGNASGTLGAFTPIGDTAAYVGSDPSLADLYASTLTVPYYLTNATTPTDPLNEFWSKTSPIDPTPIKTSDETIPLLLSIPKTGSAPWPIVIFQHGITRNRTDMFAVADALASEGFATIAIDLPLHGIVDTVSPLYSGIERTFDLDLIDNTTSAPGPDTNIDASGAHFINLSNLLVARDNVRQSVTDLFALHDALATLDYDGGGGDIETSEIYFLGHSLGGMVGTPFLALESNVRDAVLAMPGSGIAKLLDGSSTFGPIVAAGLAAAGVEKGTADYESFMAAAQTVLDSGDPANYASGAATGRGILLFEVVGDGDTNLPDQTIPNNVFADAPEGTVPAPLSGTDPLVTLLGLSQVSATDSDTGDMLSQIRYTAGDHGSILSPVSSPTVTAGMQTAAAGFFATDGQEVTIIDTSVVE